MVCNVNCSTVKWGEVDRFLDFLKHNSRSTVLISSFLLTKDIWLMVEELTEKKQPEKEMLTPGKNCTKNY